MNYLGDFPVNGLVFVPFHTFNSSGASVTISAFAVADVAIYKDGGTTQRTSTAGFTLLDTDGIDFDGITGVHGFKIDLSDNTDAGFFAAGHEYFIVVGPFTADSQTVNFVAGEFSIERTNGVLALVKARLPNAAPGAAGGVFIAGTNAPVAITGSGDALTLSSTGANGVGLNVSGNGSGAGVLATGGATGDGVKAVGGATSGSGVKAQGTAGNSDGVTIAGQGSAPGIKSTGGATGQGVKLVGGATSGEGLLVNTTSGDGIKSAPTAGHGMNLAANGTDKHGLLSTGGTAGTSDGVKFAKGTGGADVRGRFDAAMTESYAAVGVAPSLEQAVMAMHQQLQQSSTGGGTTQTVKKLDGATTALTLTLNNAAQPTSIVRAT